MAVGGRGLLALVNSLILSNLSATNPTMAEAERAPLEGGNITILVLGDGTYHKIDLNIQQT